MQPNAALMEQYGTGMDKAAQPPAARIAASILGVGAMAGDAHHVKKLRQEAALLTQAIREHEAMRMQPAIAGLTRGRIPQGQPILPSDDIDLADLEASMPMDLLKGGSAELSALGISLGKTLAKIAAPSFAPGELKKEAIVLGSLLKPAAEAVPKAKPLLSMGTKAKLLGGAGLLGAGYMGYKGMQTARDYMMMPSGQSNWGPGYAPRAGVTEYGY